jgi:UDP-glucose 4-epimerase
MVGKNSNNLIKALSEFILNKRTKFVINGSDYDTRDGTPVRDFIDINDLAEIHLIVSKYLIKNGKTDIFNCGYGNGFSVLEVVLEMEKILNKKLNIKKEERREGDIPHSVANCEKFKKKFSWSPKYNNLNNILESSLNWEKKIK